MHLEPQKLLSLTFMYHFADCIRGESIFSVGNSRSRWQSDQLPPQSNRLRKDAKVEEGITYYYFESSNQNSTINGTIRILLVRWTPLGKMKSEAILCIFSHEFLRGGIKLLWSGTNWCTVCFHRYFCGTRHCLVWWLTMGRESAHHGRCQSCKLQWEHREQAKTGI